MTLQGPFHKDVGSYRSFPYRLKVYHREWRHSGSEARLVVVSTLKSGVEGVYDSTPLEPIGSILPWRESDPDPLPMEEQIDRAMSTFESRVDQYHENRERVLR